MIRIILLGVFMFLITVGYGQIAIDISSKSTYSCPYGTDTLVVNIENGSPPYSFDLLSDRTGVVNSITTQSNSIKIGIDLQKDGLTYSINSVTDKSQQTQEVQATFSFTQIPTPNVSFSSSTYFYNSGDKVTVDLDVSSFSGSAIIKIEGSESSTFEIVEQNGGASFSNVYFSDKTYNIIQATDFDCPFSISTTPVNVVKAEDPCLGLDVTQAITLNSVCDGDEIRFNIGNWEAGNIFRIEGLPQEENYIHSSSNDFGIINQSLAIGDYSLSFFVRKSENCTNEFKLDQSVNFSVFARPTDTLSYLVSEPTCANGLVSEFVIKNTQAGYDYRTIFNGVSIQDQTSAGGDLKFTLDNFNIFSENSVFVYANNGECSVPLEKIYTYGSINSNAKTSVVDSLALVTLYDSLGGDLWTNNSEWKSSSPISKWFGVTISCGKVIKLDLQSNNVKGRIPQAIGDLTALENLNLSFDSIVGRLPSSFSNLTKLQYLDLGNSYLSGTFPQELTSLNNLTVLNINGNYLEGKVPTSISNLTKLNEFDISFNSFTDTLPVFDFISPNAPVIDLSFNNFSFVSLVPTYLAQNWEVFDAYGQNNISASFDTLVNEGTSLTLTLTQPQINGTKFQWFVSFGEGASRLIGDTLPSITFENISLNDARTYFCQLTHPLLSELEIYSGDFNVEVCKKVSIADSLKLTRIYNATGGANWINKTNWLTDKPVTDWYGIKTDCGILTEINLPNNNLIDTLPQEIDSLYSLTRLDLHGNNLSNNKLDNIITSKPNLSYLDLSKNKFSGGFPNVLAKGTEIEHLDLSDNLLSDSILNFFNGFYRIRYFDVSNNKFVGKIPSSIAQDSLKILYLNNNQFSDTLGSRLFLAKSLVVFDASNNNLTGIIPQDIVGWSDSIIVINLSNNKLSGNIPSGLWKCKGLLSLNLSKNELSDTISNDIKDLSSLSILDLSDNLFEGSIPNNIGLLSELQSINLSQNNFSGTLTKGVGGLNKLIDFNVTTNQISGKIPSEFANVSTLETLKLGNNQFQDSIPLSFVTLPKLKVLDVFNNSISFIPVLKTITSLDELYVGNNKLTFEHLLPNVGINVFQYAVQDSVLEKEVVKISSTQSISLNSLLNGAGNQYQWQRNNINIVGATQPVFIKLNATKADTGTYVCNITNPLLPMLTLHRRPLKLIACDPVIPTPIIKVADSSACLSKTLKGPSGYKFYEWYLDTYKLSNANDSVLVVVQNGGYRLSIEDNTQCKAFSSALPISVFGTLATPQIDQSQLSSDKILKSNKDQASYQWYVNDKIIIGATKVSLPIYYNGTYTLEIGTTDSCRLWSKEVVVNINGLPNIAKAAFYSSEAKSVNIPNAQTSLAQVYPNPTTGIITLELAGTDIKAEVICRDMSGRILKIFKTNSTTTINTNLGQGIYILEIKTGGNTQWEKIVIE